MSKLSLNISFDDKTTRKMKFEPNTPVGEVIQEISSLTGISSHERGLFLVRNLNISNLSFIKTNS